MISHIVPLNLIAKGMYKLLMHIYKPLIKTKIKFETYSYYCHIFYAMKFFSNQEMCKQNNTDKHRSSFAYTVPKAADISAQIL